MALDRAKSAYKPGEHLFRVLEGEARWRGRGGRRKEDSVTIRHMARARPECNGGNTRCSSAADRIIVPFLHGTCPVELLPLYSAPSSPTLLATLFPNPPFHYRGNFSRFPIRFPRYVSEIFMCVYIYMYRCLKRESGKTVATPARQACFARFLAGQSCPAWRSRGAWGEKFEGSRARLRAPSRDEILRATYVFVTYVSSPRGPPMLDGETKRITPEGSEAPKPASFPSPFPYYPASRLLFINSLSVFIERPRLFRLSGSLIRSKRKRVAFFRGKNERKR